MRDKNLFQLSFLRSSDSKFPKPKGFDYLPFQKAGIDYALESKNVLIADPPGLGKTIQAIGTANALDVKRILVIAPASLLINWEREIKTWLVVKGAKTQIIKTGKTKIDPEATVLIISYNLCINKAVYKYLSQRRIYDILILDESHYLKNPKSKRTRAILGVSGIYKRAKKTIALTGTPVVNRPIELYTIINALNPSLINNMKYLAYGIRYCRGYQGKWGWDLTGASNLKELGTFLRSGLMVRRKKEDVLPQLPSKNLSLAYLNKNNKLKKIDKNLQKFDPKMILKTNGMGCEGVDIGELATLRRELGEEKASLAVDYIKTQIEGGREKVIVFAHHKEVFKILEDGLKEFNPVKIIGGMSADKKQSSVDTFQGDENCKVFIGSIIAAGVGITLTASNYVVFVEASYVPGENEQAIDRAHRIGQENNVQADFLTFADSLDENILKAVVSKQKNISKLMLE